FKQLVSNSNKEACSLWLRQLANMPKAKSGKKSTGKKADAAADAPQTADSAALTAESPIPPATPQSRLAGYTRIDAAIDSTHTLGQALEKYGFDKEK
ncbi:hypothetical protein BOX15_Mlig005298g3, partial [Macrostomum lignano]